MFVVPLVLAVVGFCLCTVPKIHYHVLLASTAAVGATAFVLGIDCFTTANLKEVRLPFHFLSFDTFERFASSMARSRWSANVYLRK